jgi:2-oxoglutarate dehydrogenase E1 component
MSPNHIKGSGRNAGRMPSMTSPSEESSFLSAQNAAFIGDLLARFRADPASVDASWRAFFAALADGEAEPAGPSWGNGHAANGSSLNGWAEAFALELPAEIATPARSAPQAVPAAAPGIDAIRRAALDTQRAIQLIRAYRVRGHLLADLDPLGLVVRKSHPDLDPASFGFTDADMDRPIFIDGQLGLDRPTLRQILDRLRATYCGYIGVEYLHIQDPAQRAWIQDRIELIDNRTEFTVTGKRAIYERLAAGEVFEHFLNLKYTGTKRFGLDGGEAMIPALEQVMKRGGQLGLEEIVIGMAHRGRLNVLASVMQKPFAAIFSEFQGNPANPEDVQGSGDVKYHLGTSDDRDFDGKTIHLSLTANPSHLECVDPVVIGKVRAKQMQRRDEDRIAVMPLLIHGDAAFAGQGVVAETLMLSELKGYRVGGTFHFIINNQIGFTTSPAYSRSGPYCTDVAKAVQAPIFHVNGDRPEAVVHVCRIATEFRQRFKKDVVVDMFCYRRFGHNEGLEPTFTQPAMYRTIATHKTTRALYAEQLAAEGVLPVEEAEAVRRRLTARLEQEFEAAQSYKPNKADWLGGVWSGFTIAEEGDRRGKTGISEETFHEIGSALTRVPARFNLHSKVARLFRQKDEMMATGRGIDWATAEALAFGALLVEGVPVRLSGQDSGNGTFSQRHAVLFDQDTDERYVSLNHIRPGQAALEVHDSPLSEFAVLGFEYGHSLAEPRALTIWEAQFGDFANGAQVIIDQFISSGEQKWLRMSGLVMLLPHGYEGQGPEHSSGRIERFLQQSAEDNWQIVNPTTPANYFHVLRRQIRRDFRKPLVVFTPKSLLRHKECVSDLDLFVNGSTFHRVLHETGVDLAPDAEIRRVVLCSGKVYYDLKKERDERGLRDVTILRFEQLFPFPRKPLRAELERFPNADIVWCQEEPQNQGAWYFVDRRIEALLAEIDHPGAKRPVYVGRPEAAAPATGLLRRHNQEQAKIVDRALTIG